MAKGKGKGLRGSAGDAMNDIGVGTAVKKGPKAMTSGQVQKNTRKVNPHQGGHK